MANNRTTKASKPLDQMDATELLAERLKATKRLDGAQKTVATATTKIGEIDEFLEAKGLKISPVGATNTPNKKGVRDAMKAAWTNKSTTIAVVVVALSIVPVFFAAAGLAALAGLLFSLTEFTAPWGGGASIAMFFIVLAAAVFLGWILLSKKK